VPTTDPHRHEIMALLEGRVRLGAGSSGGPNIAAYCPFHKGGAERRPSLYVYVGPTTQYKHPGMAFCHTCNEGWSLPGLMRRLGVSGHVLEAAQQIVEETKPRVEIDRFRMGLGLDLPAIPEAILGLYSYVPKAMLALGFEAELLRRYEIGFDRKLKRIIFPIRSHTGELVGLSGRSVRGDNPKYRIYKEELHGIIPGYSLTKGKVLWGLDKLYAERLEAHASHPLVVCEGFKAALWCIQNGYPHTVALMGSYLSESHAILLTRVANEVVLFLDNNSAGINGTRSALRRVRGVRLTVANYNTGEPISPDDLNKDGVRHAVEEALPPIDWEMSHNEHGRLQQTSA
jgi:DNA primase